MSSRQREQKLQACYDAFDVRNYKGVIKLSNAALQKHPDSPVFKSLKAVALERTGKLDEALQVAEQVLAAAPPDDHVLNMLLLVLKPANRVADLQHAYEAACSKDPGNEELLQGLFACHVRCFNFREQQAVAMKLNKLHPSEQYQWWVVNSIALQAHMAASQAQLAAKAAATSNGSSSSDGTADKPSAAAAGVPGLGADKLLQLAEAMAGRLLAKQAGGSPSWEAVMLYLGLLQAQGKHGAALAAVRGPLASAISLPAERREAEASLLLDKGDLAAAAALYQAAVQEQPDDWALLLLYMDCLLPGTASTLPATSSAGVAQMLCGVEASTMPGFLAGGLEALVTRMTAGEGSSSPATQECLAQAEDFIRSLTATAQPDGNGALANSSSAKPAPLLRGPALAEVELVKRKLLLGVADQQALMEALLTYHDRFGHVVSCAMDVRDYLPLLAGDTRTTLGQRLAERAEQAAAELQQQQQQQQQPAGSSKSLLKLLRRQMAARQIQADLGGPFFTDAAAAQQHAQQLMQLYAAALPFYDGLDERERGPADELLWLAAAALVKAAELQQQQQQGSGGGGSSGSSSSSSIHYMLLALLVLEAAAKGRPYCAPARLGLTGLHGLMGNARAALQHFGMLDVKHIQHDTLSSHHLLPLLLGLGAEGPAGELLQSTLTLFEDHLRDAGDTLMQAYRKGSHTKVLEFVCFKERLERSHTFVLARAEQAIQEISKAAATAPDAAAAAAASAAAKLPLQLLDSCDWQGMRFNDDLTTRLPWLPPIQGPRHLVVLLWWEQQQQRQQQQQSSLSSSSSSSSCSSQQSCWWQRVAAAEADLQPAACLRASTKAAAQQRWLLPHLLAVATAATNGGTAKGSIALEHQQSKMQQLLVSYAAALGTSLPGLEQQLSSCFGGQQAGAGSAPVSRQLQLLDAALFTLAEPVQELLHAVHGDQGRESSSTTAACSAITQHAQLLVSALQQLQQQVAVELQGSRAYLGCLLPGHVLSLGVLLVVESCTWTLLCLEAWSKSVKQARSKKKTKKQAAAAPVVASLLQLEHVQAAVQSLASVQAALDKCLEAVASSAGQLLAVLAAQAEGKLLAEFDPSSNALLQALVGWEPRASVQHVLVDAVKAQRQVLQQMHDASGKLQKRSAHISW